LVVRLAWGPHSLLLTGDIEAAAEDALLARHGNFLRSSVLKVPHHGSRSSSTPAFLAAVQPRLALVSGLPGRHPMPPHAEVLDRYAMLGIPTHITGRDGAIRVTWQRDGTERVVPRHPPENEEPQQAGADCGSFGTPTCSEKVRSP
jgi:competence protein ComEC